VRQTSSCLTYLRHFVDVRAERAINGRAAYSGSRFASSKPCGTAAAKRLAPPTFVEMSHVVEAPGPQICLNYVRRHGQNVSTSMRQDTGHVSCLI